MSKQPEPVFNKRIVQLGPEISPGEAVYLSFGISGQRQQQSVELTTNAEQDLQLLLALREQRDDLKQTFESLDRQVRAMERSIARTLMDYGLSTLRFAKMDWKPEIKVLAKTAKGRAEDLKEWLVNHGKDSVVVSSVNAARLTSLVKEYPILPPDLAELIIYDEEVVLKTTKVKDV